jgi:endonuclease/exonuclease/phosphatase family metal-dependent hydrolase
MNEAAQKRPSLIKRIVNWMALAYLIVMVVYFVLRLTIGDGIVRLSMVNSFAYLLFTPLPLLLILALLVRSRLAFVRLLPVLVVLVVWIGPRFVPKSVVAASNEETIRIFAGNAWAHNVQPDLLEKRLRESGADVLCLEEIMPDMAATLLPKLRDLYPYEAFQKEKNRKGDNFTLSKYPIVSSNYVDLGISGAASPVRSVINVDSQLVAVYTVHLLWPVAKKYADAYTMDWNTRVVLGFDDTLRNQQIDRLLNYLKEEPYPYIVAGDFNTSDFSVTYSKLAATLHDSFAEGGVGLGGSWPVAHARGLPSWLPPLIRIDYIWHSDGLRTIRAWQGAETGSDHLPLIADLALEG